MNLQRANGTDVAVHLEIVRRSQRRVESDAAGDNGVAAWAVVVCSDLSRSRSSSRTHTRVTCEWSRQRCCGRRQTSGAWSRFDHHHHDDNHNRVFVATLMYATRSGIGVCYELRVANRQRHWQHVSNTPPQPKGFSTVALQSSTVTIRLALPLQCTRALAFSIVLTLVPLP